MTIKRMAFLQELLSFVGVGGRLHVSWISSAEAGKFGDVTIRFTEKIKTMGPNPLTDYCLAEWLEKVRAGDRIPAGSPLSCSPDNGLESFGQGEPR